MTAIALAMTFPIWISVNLLGDPDNGLIVASYLGSWLMAGAILAVAACVSALNKNQVIAFIVGAAVCFLFLMSGVDLVLGAFRAWAPDFVIELIASLSFLTHFVAITQGVVDVRDVIYFVSLMVAAVYVNTVIVDLKKAA